MSSRSRSLPLRAGRLRSRRGFSLLETVLALAILTGALAVLGELVRLATTNAAGARDLTQAQLHCESKLAELMAGIVPLEPVSLAPLEFDPAWLYSVEVQSAEQPGLLLLTVTVVQDLPPAHRPAEFSLSRLVVDPSLASSTATGGGP